MESSNFDKIILPDNRVWEEINLFKVLDSIHNLISQEKDKFRKFEHQRKRQINYGRIFNEEIQTQQYSTSKKMR